MASIINTNISSLTAQRHLSSSQNSLATSMQRLSSGLRINSAKDDAAGLAISERFTTQIRGFSQAARNANDGISLAQTAEGALGEINSNLQRIRELAVQSVNVTNSASDRAALNAEVQQRVAEIDRVAVQTTFNGQKILDGSFGTAAFQVGADVGQTISVGLSTSMTQAHLGQVAATVSNALDAVVNGGILTVPASSGSLGAFNTQISLGAGNWLTLTVAGVQVFNQVSPSGTSFVTAADIDGANGLGNATVQSNLAAAGITVTGSAQGGDLTFNRASGVNFTVDLSESLPPAFEGGFAAINGGAGSGNLTTSNGVQGSFTPLADGDLVIQVGEQDAVSISGTFASVQALADAINDKTGGAALASVNGAGRLQMESDQDLTITGNNTHGLASASASSGSLSDLSVSTVAGANTAILRMDSALTSVSTLRSTFGAIQNRFDSVIANLATTTENLSASRSRVLDTDFAAETANLSRAQILQQAGTAMVAQANQLPQGVLALLR